MAETKAPTNKLWLIVYFLVALIVVAAGAYFFISRAQNSPEAVYRRALKTIGVGLERFASPEAISQASGVRFDGYLAIDGFSRQDGQEGLEQFGLYNPNDPDAVACFGQLAETDNQLRFELGSNLNDPVGDELLGPTQVEADLSLNQSTIGGVELRIIPGDEPTSLPPIYFMIDKTACLEQLTASLPVDVLGTWWLVDTSQLLGDQLGGELSDLLTAIDSATEDPEDDSTATQADYNELIEIITSSLNTYVFTDDPQQMVFQMTDSIDKQAEFDGQTGLYKYDVDLNKANTVALLTELEQKIRASQLYQKLIDELGDVADEELLSQEDIDELSQSIDEFKQDNKIEIWVNPKTKLLRNLRITNIKPTSKNLGSAWDLGLMVSDEEEITVDIKTTTFSATNQCQSTKDGLELSSDEYNQQADCPYLLDPNQPPEAVSELERCPTGSDLYQADAETFSRCALAGFEEKVYTRSLKDNPTPYQVQSLQVTFGFSGQSFGVNYQISIDEAEISFGIEAVTQPGEPVLAPPDARPFEELFGGIGLGSSDLFAPPRNNTRAADVNLIASAINQFIANRNALPASWSEIEPLVGSHLAFYQPDKINAAGAWGDNSVAGEFVDLSTVGDLNETQAAGGVKLASDDADASDYLMVFRKAGCSGSGQSLQAAGIREITIVYKLEGQANVICLEV